MSLSPSSSSEAIEKAVRLVAEAQLPSRFGSFRIIAFESSDGKEHMAVVKGEIAGGTSIPVRVHSECFTGDVMGSLKCDCRDQLEASLEIIGESDAGVVIYLRQEGRGIGLVNKIRAYALQDAGLDTVEANQALGFADDLRRYDIAAEMLKELRVQSIRIFTNNPAKVQGLSNAGVVVEGVIPLRVGRNPFNQEYLDTKKKKSGHWL
jgi:GTP cyclohydrolase II